MVRRERLGRELLLLAEGFAHYVKITLHLREGHRARHRLFLGWQPAVLAAVSRVVLAAQAARCQALWDH